MAAPKGNKYYLLAKNFKKPKRYAPKKLWEIFLEYIEWCDKYPLYETKVFGTGLKVKVPIMRAATIKGFCSYANMSKITFYNYKENKAYLNIIEKIENMLFAIKFEGAAGGLLKENIIARELGLKEGQDIDVKSEGAIIILPERNEEN